MNRIFLEWHDSERPNWGGFMSTVCYSSNTKEFIEDFVDFVRRCGPPTKVEYRKAGEGYECS